MEAVFARNELFGYIFRFLSCQQRLNISRVSKEWLRVINFSITELYFLSRVQDNLKSCIERRAFLREPRWEDWPTMVERFPSLQTLGLWSAHALPLEKGTVNHFLIESHSLVFPKCAALKSLKLEGLRLQDPLRIFEHLCLLPNSLTKLSIDWGVS